MKQTSASKRKRSSATPLNSTLQRPSANTRSAARASNKQQEEEQPEEEQSEEEQPPPTTTKRKKAGECQELAPGRSMGQPSRSSKPSRQTTVKRPTSASQRPKPRPKPAQQHFRAVNIDVDAPDDPPTSARPPAKKRKSVQQVLTVREEQEDHSSDDTTEDNTDGEHERDEDRMAAEHPEEETPIFIENSSDDEDNTNDCLSPRSHSGPPGAHVTGGSDGVEETSEEEQTYVQRSKSSKRTRKLEYEAAQISKDNLPTARSKAATPARIPTPTLASEHHPWLPHTEVHVITEGATSSLNGLNGQPSVMRKVIQGAIALGKFLMLTDHQSNPLGDEMKELALAALLQYAEEKGYTETRDVVNRLEEGDEATYKKPIIDYRIGAERSKELKRSSDAVLSAFGLLNLTDPESGQMVAHKLILEVDFMYANSSVEGEYDYTKPFQNPAYIPYIRATFFGNNLYSRIIARSDHAKIFRSSNEKKPKELEIPKSMVALATAGIHAILQDYYRGSVSAFPDNVHPGVYTTAINVMNNFEAKNRPLYHKIMHEMYIKTSGAAAMSGRMTNEQMYNKVDWSALAAIQVDDD
ncbi:hypothetical protein K435DRAFT_503034 [Dendrothele bispora CBS 962.96]|uniref:DUF6532 domain-containing protein n=1 Tax=Dendrothele bispora (strain CBS 962.96) TaxID=1314807 RepID=A0A4V4HGM4_DENBC|nr:hypothetical protein K435DRAFT_503034 [Dendrothele bispora CBS 962.96]